MFFSAFNTIYHSIPTLRNLVSEFLVFNLFKYISFYFVNQFLAMWLMFTVPLSKTYLPSSICSNGLFISSASFCILSLIPAPKHVKSPTRFNKERETGYTKGHIWNVYSPGSLASFHRAESLFSERSHGRNTSVRLDVHSHSQEGSVKYPRGSLKRTHSGHEL